MQLEKELQSKLHQTRVSHLRNLSELRSVREITVGIEELGMVEDIEELGSEINVLAFVDSEGLQDREIAVADMRAATDSTR